MTSTPAGRANDNTSSVATSGPFLPDLSTATNEEIEAAMKAAEQRIKTYDRKN
jgi:predicted outer membrane protein